jgi:hypothetical protein
MTEEPSMLELMIEAQKQADQKTKEVSSIEIEVKTKSFASGFKKGFLGQARPQNAVLVESSKKKSNALDVNKIVGPGNSSSAQNSALVFQDVQNAMAAQNPLAELQKGGISFTLIYSWSF